MKKIIRYLLLLLAAPILFCGCDQEDNVLEIFDSGVWSFVNYYTSVDWDSNNDRTARPKYTDKDDVNTICKFTLIFDSDGTFSGELSKGVTYSGRWEADPKDRTFAVIGSIQSNAKLTGMNAEFVNTLKEARFYRGDSKMMLRLAPENKTHCMQFTHR